MCYTDSMRTTTIDIRHRLTNHPPETKTAASALDKITAAGIQFGAELVELLPESREASLALTHLEEAVMFAKAAIVRNQ